MAVRLGQPFMPWQQHVADVVMELVPDEVSGRLRLAYDEYDITIPRQSGKTTWVLSKASHRASARSFFGGRQRMVYTAQTRIKAREKLEEDFAPILAKARDFARVQPYWGTGNEHLRYPNGSKLAIESGTEKAGHGGTLDEAFVDEAFAHMDSRLEQAFRPAMITRPLKQLGVLSTAGWSDASLYLQKKVRRGREAVATDVRRGLAYFEWSAPDGADPADEEVWRSCMPALGHTITVEAVRAELGSMELADFMRAYLNMWVPRAASSGWQVISQDEWRDLLDEDSQLVGPEFYAVDVPPSRASAVISVAGAREDGLTHVEVVERGEGLDWVPRWFTDRGLYEVVLDERGAARSLKADLEEANVRVVCPSAADVAAAAGRLFDATRPAARSLRHRGQPILDEAVEGATTRPLGDAWTWDRRKQTTDISALVSASLALGAFETAPKGGPSCW